MTDITPGNEGRLYHISLSVCLSILLHGMLLSLAPGKPGASVNGVKSNWSAKSFTVDLPQGIPTTETSTVAMERPVLSQAERPVMAVPSMAAANTIANSTSETRGSNGLFSGPWYYPARYLHRHPSPLKPIWPDYPASAQNIAGRVTITLFINEEGRVDQYRIGESDPNGIFDSAVIRAFTEANYVPGMIADVPVKSQLVAEVSFTPGAPPRMQLAPGTPSP